MFASKRFGNHAWRIHTHILRPLTTKNTSPASIITRPRVFHVGSLRKFSQRNSNAQTQLARFAFQMWVRLVVHLWRSGQFKGEKGKRLFKLAVVLPSGLMGGCGAIYFISSVDTNPGDTMTPPPHAT